MVHITVELVRKRAEHHDRQLAPLEEIALHQENIERLEHLQHWCPELRILLLQSNLIPRIENLSRLKNLTYLNLALNNIEVIENLQGCESLRKLDLTLNFIGEIKSVESLAGNYNLETLYLTGNPCTDYEHYRTFVVATLPQLTSLDSADIERSERIRALQELPRTRADVLDDQRDYRCRRSKQKVRLLREMEERQRMYEPLDEEERNKRYWQEKCEHAPEVRLEMEKFRNMNLQSPKGEVEERKKRPLFAGDGRPFNVNEPKIPFKFEETEEQLTLNLEVYRHLDTSLIDIDIQPLYVRATLKGKILQLALPAEVKTSQSTAQRSQTTGHLLLTMPRLNVLIKKKNVFRDDDENKDKDRSDGDAERRALHSGQSRREYLEIGSSQEPELDFTKMTRSHAEVKYVDPRFLAGGPKQLSSEFVDNPDVPALE